MKLGDFLASTATAGSAAPTATPDGATATTTTPTSPWVVRGTKKGGLPVKVETRRNGKVVVISNIEGDLNALLTDVKKALGTGGVARPTEGYVEIQGAQHEKTVCTFLLRSGNLVGVKKDEISKATKKNKKSAGSQGSNKSDGKAALKAKAAGTQPTKSKVAVEAGAAIPDTKTIKAMKPPELKAHLHARGESTQGNKKELVARLLALKDS